MICVLLAVALFFRQRNPYTELCVDVASFFFSFRQVGEKYIENQSVCIISFKREGKIV